VQAGSMIHQLPVTTGFLKISSRHAAAAARGGVAAAC